MKGKIYHNKTKLIFLIKNKLMLAETMPKTDKLWLFDLVGTAKTKRLLEVFRLNLGIKMVSHIFSVIVGEYFSPMQSPKPASN
jgi:hypothetical protein